MVRAATKNFAGVAVVVESADHTRLLAAVIDKHNSPRGIGRGADLARRARPGPADGLVRLV